MEKQVKQLRDTLDIQLRKNQREKEKTKRPRDTTPGHTVLMNDVEGDKVINRPEEKVIKKAIYREIRD